MAATAAPASLKWEIEGDLQVLYCTIASVADTNTTDFTGHTKNIVGLNVIPSTSAAVGATISNGVITWKVSSGTPNLIVRLAFD